MNFLSTYYIRLSRIYNKSRYSRNRQSTRVVYYLSLYINIAIIFYIFYVMYNIGFIEMFFWWYLFFIYVGVFIGWVLKHRK